MVADATLKPVTIVNMVADAKAYYAILQGDTSCAFGRWATFDNVSSQAYARNELAITEGMKSGDLRVIQVKVTQPQRTDRHRGSVGGCGGRWQSVALQFTTEPENKCPPICTK
jgi:hypothetical protein